MPPKGATYRQILQLPIEDCPDPLLQCRQKFRSRELGQGDVQVRIFRHFSWQAELIFVVALAAAQEQGRVKKPVPQRQTGPVL